MPLTLFFYAPYNNELLFFFVPLCYVPLFFCMMIGNRVTKRYVHPVCFKTYLILKYFMCIFYDGLYTTAAGINWII